MKNFLKIMGTAFLGGCIALGGYKFIIEKQHSIEKSTAQSNQVFQANYTPTNYANTSSASLINFTEAAEKTVNAVVHVKNTSIQTSVSSYQDFFYRQAQPRKFEQVGTGSGVVISSDGHIITNNHVIKNATEIEITLNNKKKYIAKLVGTDVKNDIALLKIDTDDALPYVPFANSDTTKIGEWVLAVGNPYNLTSTVTAGIVSAKGRDLEGNAGVESFIQTDAAVNPGNSGGALVNTRGELIGINTAISSKTGSFVGYSFAVPSNIARKIVDDILEFGNVQEAVIGFSTYPKEDIEGVTIATIMEESNAKKAGLKEGDVIKKINNIKITKFSDLKGHLTAKRPGETVEVTLDRNGKILVKNVKLIKKTERYIFNRFGWELKDLSNSELKKNGIKHGVKIIESRQDDSLEGYIIFKINGQKITSAVNAIEILNSLSNSYSYSSIEMISPSGERERFRIR